LADRLGGDRNSTDAARVLRVPDTINQKYDHQPVVTTIFKKDFRYPLEDIAGELGVDDTDQPQQCQPRPQPTFESQDMPPCIKHILTALPKTNLTTFNKLVIDLVTYFHAAGYSREEAAEAANFFLTNYPHSTNYQTPEAREKHFYHEWNYLPGKGKGYEFKCSFILGKKFPGAAFSCSKCALNGGEYNQKGKQYVQNFFG
jgi:hypothetical protein